MDVNDKLDISINTYLGKLENGVLVLLSIICEGNVYEATYWYNEEYKVLTLESRLNSELGDVKDLDEYDSIMEFLDKETSNYNEIYETLEDVKF